MTGVVPETVALLGRKATDKVTGYSGVITSVCFDLYGCIQVALTPPALSDGSDMKTGHWFDVHRLNVDMADKVMPTPDFNAYGTKPAEYSHGPAIKPEQRNPR